MAPKIGKNSVFIQFGRETPQKTLGTVIIVFNGQKYASKDVFHDFVVSSRKSPYQPLLLKSTILFELHFPDCCNMKFEKFHI